MKTIQREILKNMNDLAILFIFISTVLFFSSCSKDNSIQPAAASDPTEARAAHSAIAIVGTSDVVETDHTLAPIVTLVPKLLIRINHVPEDSRGFDYSVTVFSNHKGVFEGRANTAVHGKVVFDIGEADFKYITALLSMDADNGNQNSDALVSDKIEQRLNIISRFVVIDWSGL